MAYESEHGKASERGHQLGTTITGQGVLPCGTYTVTIKLVSDGNFVFEEAARGTHAEELTDPPTWCNIGDEVDIEIGLSKGVYARLDRGKIALFDSITEQNITGWKTLADFNKLQGKWTTAQPIVKQIKKKQGNAALIWRAK